MAILILLLTASFIAGSFPTSILTGKYLKNIDIRQHGSGNAGATNAFRILGWKPALFVLFIDDLFLKNSLNRPSSPMVQLCPTIL